MNTESDILNASPDTVDGKTGRVVVRTDFALGTKELKNMADEWGWELNWCAFGVMDKLKPPVYEVCCGSSNSNWKDQGTAPDLPPAPPGKIQVKPGTAAMGPGYDIDGGGWQLVRRTSSGIKWHTATDHCDGSAVYGAPSSKSDGSDTFSVRFDNIDYDEFLFASGDGKHWLITTKDAVGGRFNNQWYSNAQRSIIKASDNSKPHTAAWYNRQGQAEDPWISLTDHWDSITKGLIVYGENSYSAQASHLQLLRNHKGANVFVRKAPKRKAGPGLKLDVDTSGCG